MNRKPLDLLAGKAIIGCLQYKTALALSPNTLVSYESVLRLWLSHVGEVHLSTITSSAILEFLAWCKVSRPPDVGTHL